MALATRVQRRHFVAERAGSAAEEADIVAGDSQVVAEAEDSRAVAEAAADGEAGGREVKGVVRKA